MPDSPTPARADVLPRRAPALTVVAFDGEQVIYDPARREAHLLNPTAALVLDRCDGRTPVDTLVAELAATYDADPAVVGHDVELVLADFAGRELAARPGDPSPDRPTAEPAPVAPDAAAFSGPGPRHAAGGWAWESPVLDALGWRTKVRSDEPLVARYVEQVFASLAEPAAGADAPPGGAPVPTFDVVAEGDVVHLLLDGQVLTTVDDLDAAMTYLHWQINQLAIESVDDHVLLHASGVRRPDGVAVFPAESNSGKSTLAAGLVQAGLGYVTDEAVAIELGDGMVEPFPKPISLDPGSWPIFPTLEPSIEGAAGRFFHHEWHLDPRTLHPGALADLGARQPVTLVAFPRYEMGAETHAELMRPAEALLGLLRNAFNLAIVGPPGVHALANVAREATVVRLTVGDLAEAVALVGALS